MPSEDTQWRPGPDHRRGHGGRPNPLNDPEFAQKVAEAVAAGSSRTTMCEMFGVKDPDTITRWKRDPRVKVRAFKLIEDRVLDVTRKVDGVIAARLENAKDMTIQELIMIRKEFLGGAARAQTEKADELTINEAQEWLDTNPEAAAQLEEIMTTGAVPGVSAATEN